MAKLDRTQLIDVIEAKSGVVTAVAAALGVTRTAIYDARDRWPTVAVALAAARHNYDSGLLDEAELRLREAVLEGEGWAVRYVLDKKGRERGYLTESSIQHQVEEETTVRVVFDKMPIKNPDAIEDKSYLLD